MADRACWEMGLGEEKDRMGGAGRRRSLRGAAGLVKLGDILRETMKRRHYEVPLARHQIWDIWEELVGSTLAEVSQPEEVKFSTLSVRVRDPAWMQHLLFMRETLLLRIQRRLGPGAITKIYFRLDGG